MARVFVEGLESGGHDRFDASSGAAVISSSGLNMDGSYCLDLLGQADYVTKVITADTEIYCAFLYRANTLSYNTLVSIFDGATTIFALQCDVDENIHAYRGGYLGTSLGVLTFPLASGTTYFIEIRFKLSDTVGVVTVKSNGITVFNYSGDTNPGASTTFDRLRFGAAGGSYGYGYSYYDNIIIDDANWIGKTWIQAIVPTGSGTNTNMTPSAGANYECVDELPASDTDYLSTNSNDVIDTFAAGNLAGSIGAIRSVTVQARVKKEGASTPQNIKLAMISGSTTDLSDNKALPTDYATVSEIWELDPDTGSAFTESGVNALEIGVKSAA